jgi:tripartite-type tricarboxylate transporter receptor subunit TctC
MTAAAAAAMPAWGQDYASRPITLVVPFAAGGSSDILARVFGAALGNRLRQPVVIENKPGAGGIIAAEYVARSAPDGYTLLFGTIGTHAIIPAIKKTMPFDTVKDFTAISRLTDGLLVLLVHPSLPVRNLDELIAYAKANPNKLSYASAGIGSMSHLAGEMFRSEAHVDIVHVPYKGGGSAMPDLQGGHVQMMLETIASSLSAIKSGRVRALAISSAHRSPALPDVPTFAESGLPKLSLITWTGLFGPAHMPPDIVNRLSAELVKIDADPAYIASVEKNGSLVAPATSPAQFASFVAGEAKLWQQAATTAGVEPE